MGAERRENVRWVEGVRGMASFMVVTTHLCRAWNYHLWFPRDTPETAPTLLQLQFLRIPWQGRIGVTMFAFLTGYVCAIKPLRQVKSGNLAGALVTLGKSAFRRPPRFILPATIALFIAWLIAQLGGFNVSSRCDSEWLRLSSPKDIGSLDTEIPRLVRNFQSVWSNGQQEYDDHQWALLPLLQGAFTIYITLLATVFMKFRFRVFTLLTLFMWYWMSNMPEKETFECQFLYGVLLCDIGSDPAFRTFISDWPRTRRTIYTVLIILGLYCASFPGERPDYAPWSQRMMDIGWYIFPKDTTRFDKRWTAIGWDFIAAGIWLSPTLQDLFSNKIFMWLGRNSFAVYLTHGTLLRVVLVRFIYGFSLSPFGVEKVEGQDPIFHWIPRSDSYFVFIVAIPIWFAILYAIAHLWTTYVDSFCAKVTRALEDYMFENEDEKSGGQFA